MKYGAVLFVALVAVLVVQTKADACLAMDDTMDDGTLIDCNHFFNSKIDYQTWNIYCCEEADEVPKFDLSSGSMSCECV
ncbi:hypothetical protein PoB_006706600 [Plakobranchus ocellatus]|uniref:Plethodontid modulating factor n=1 Tax=Plakobranchus ocellatus TaxID=259542 RepID=A0AAV4D9E8_9GAST|nr:hypothetical protein PoB_006706600 [Plakobranchus ocellatus]